MHTPLFASVFLMKRRFLPALLIVVTLLSALPPSVSAQTRARLIVPGQRIGRIRLGWRGIAGLPVLGKPIAWEEHMQQLSSVWVATGKTPYTLYVYTCQNDGAALEPSGKYSVTGIRVSSPWFHTRNGAKTGATLASLRRRYPGIRVWAQDNHSCMYADERLGVAFEFPRNAPSARCMGISIWLSKTGVGGPVWQKEMRNTLSEGEGETYISPKVRNLAKRAL